MILRNYIPLIEKGSFASKIEWSFLALIGTNKTYIVGSAKGGPFEAMSYSLGWEKGMDKWLGKEDKEKRCDWMHHENQSGIALSSGGTALKAHVSTM